MRKMRSHYSQSHASCGRDPARNVGQGTDTHLSSLCFFFIHLLNLFLCCNFFPSFIFFFFSSLYCISFSLSSSPFHFSLLRILIMLSFPHSPSLSFSSSSLFPSPSYPLLTPLLSLLFFYSLSSSISPFLPPSSYSPPSPSSSTSPCLLPPSPSPPSPSSPLSLLSLPPSLPTHSCCD